MFCTDSRRVLWEHIKSNSLCKLMEFLHVSFCQLFDKYATDSEGFGCCLAAWYQNTGTLDCKNVSSAASNETWLSIVTGYTETVSTLDRSALVSASSSYIHFLSKGITLCSINLEKYSAKCSLWSWAHHDSSLYQLFGFTLFVGIQFRKKVLYGYLHKHNLPSKRKEYEFQLQIIW